MRCVGQFQSAFLATPLMYGQLEMHSHSFLLNTPPADPFRVPLTGRFHWGYNDGLPWSEPHPTVSPTLPCLNDP
jgi:hypothetical protein